jgi:predicted HTH transcriptional regulator
MTLFKKLQSLIDKQQPVENLHPGKIADLPDPLRQIMVHITRLGKVTAMQLAQELSQSETAVANLLKQLVNLGYLERHEQQEQTFFEPAFGRRRARQVPDGIWSALNREIQG